MARIPTRARPVSHLARFIGFNALVAWLAIPAAGLAWRLLPTPAQWVAVLFIATAAGGLFIVSLLKLILRLLEP